MDGYEKSGIYAKYKSSLKLALKNEFWLQAIFIEYAIFEDRAESVIRHAGNIKLTNKRGQDLKLYEKINKIKSCSAFTDQKVRKYLTIQLLEDVTEWKRNRDRIIHSMMKISMADEFIKEVALEGEQLVKTFDGKVKSVNRIFDKANQA